MGKAKSLKLIKKSGGMIRTAEALAGRGSTAR